MRSCHVCKCSGFPLSGNRLSWPLEKEDICQSCAIAIDQLRHWMATVPSPHLKRLMRAVVNPKLTQQDPSPDQNAWLAELGRTIEDEQFDVDNGSENSGKPKQRHQR